MPLRSLSLALCALVLSAPAASAADAPHRNVLLLVADDLGMQVGCYGDKAAKTPNLDALAKSGTRFTHGFASVASCSASRATLLTGLPTHACGQFGHAHAPHNQHTFRTVQSLPKLLGKAGYRTGVVGKLHVQPKEVYPFDVEITQGLGGNRDVAAMARAARKFMAESGDRPFFLLVGFSDPHRAAKGFGNEKSFPGVPATRFDPKELPVPYHLPDRPEVRQELAEFYQSVSRMDHGVGLVLEALRETKNADNTLVIFVSDNGIPFPGAKTTLYDAGVHLPFIVREPGQKKTGVVNTALVSFTDVAPTALDWAGLKPPAAMPGRSLQPILTQEKPSGWDEVYASHQFHEITMYYPVRMVRTRTHKYLLNIAHPLEYPSASDLWASPTWQGILKRGDKMMGERSVAAFLHRPREELYDLTADPHELKNLAADPKSKEVLGQLRGKLKAWQERTNDPWLVKYQHE